MKKPVVGIEQDASGQRHLTVLCPDCEKLNRYPFATLEAGSQLSCACGVAFNLSLKNFDDLQERFGLGQESKDLGTGETPQDPDSVN